MSQPLIKPIISAAALRKVLQQALESKSFYSEHVQPFSAENHPHFRVHGSSRIKIRRRLGLDGTGFENFSIKGCGKKNTFFKESFDVTAEKETDYLVGKKNSKFENERVSFWGMKKKFERRGLVTVLTSSSRCLFFLHDFVQFIAEFSKLKTYFGKFFTLWKGEGAGGGLRIACFTAIDGDFPGFSR